MDKRENMSLQNTRKISQFSYVALASVSLFLSLAVFVGCTNSSSEGKAANKKPTIGVCFETLQTEFWVAGLDAIVQECNARGVDVVQAVADGDANRQLSQVKNFIVRGVDGIILVPKDTKTCGPMIRAANAANIPIALFNRPAADKDSKCVAVVADNLKLAEQTTAYLLEQAKAREKPIKAMILLGDLSDENAIKRRDGFNAAVAASGLQVDVVSQVPTEWNQEKAQAGVVNGLQANPDINLIFTSSDFLLPSIVSALKSSNHYFKADQAEHVILGGFDGDATAFQLLQEGYLDATGVQDVYFEAKACVDSVLKMREGQEVAATIEDPGFVIHRGNMEEKKKEMWGAQSKKP
jgi:inositol transport system substrate-binding protein